MVAYTKPQQRTEEESERLRGERDKIKYIDVRLEQGQIVGFGKEQEARTFRKLPVRGTSDDTWDRVCA